MDRTDLEDRLLLTIRQAMRRNPSMIDDAILHGRIGLKEMPEGELREYAADCWGIVDPDYIIVRKIF